jgi:hypothetical protein
MPKSGKTPSPKDPVSPDLFFEKELAGESALTRATATKLYDLGADFYALRPWDVLSDQDLIMLEVPDTGEMCYCSVMGALGQVFSLQVYIGPEGYQLFKRVAVGQPITAGEFFASLRSVSVEFVASGELTPPDRRLLRAFSHPFRKGVVCPMFRAGRPGYHPWHVTEDEGRLLALCLQTVLVFCNHLLSHRAVAYWGKEDIYPLVSLDTGRRHNRKCKVTLTPAQWTPLNIFGPSDYDKDRVARILKKGHPVTNILEVDHFYGAATFGGKHERPACMRVAIATDARSGFAFPPVLGEPSDTKGDLLVRVVLGAIESAASIPQEIRVKGADSAMALSSLANVLGLSVQVAESLPALEEFKQHMLRMMGDPGTVLNREPGS